MGQTDRQGVTESGEMHHATPSPCEALHYTFPAGPFACSYFPSRLWCHLILSLVGDTQGPQSTLVLDCRLIFGDVTTGVPLGWQLVNKRVETAWVLYTMTHWS